MSGIWWNGVERMTDEHVRSTTCHRPQWLQVPPTCQHLPDCEEGSNGTQCKQVPGIGAQTEANKEWIAKLSIPHLVIRHKLKEAKPFMPPSV